MGRQAIGFKGYQKSNLRQCPVKRSTTARCKLCDSLWWPASQDQRIIRHHRRCDRRRPSHALHRHLTVLKRLPIITTAIPGCLCAGGIGSVQRQPTTSNIPATTRFNPHLRCPEEADWRHNYSKPARSSRNAKSSRMSVRSAIRRKWSDQPCVHAGGGPVAAKQAVDEQTELVEATSI